MGLLRAGDVAAFKAVVEQVRRDAIAAGMDPAAIDRKLLGNLQTLEHDPAPGAPQRILRVSASDDNYEPFTAMRAWFGIRSWRVVVVSVIGALRDRLADQRQIGRVRAGGERSPAPLPDWYELTHLVYQHGPELGLDPTRAVYQYLPGSEEEYLNVAEALHLRQPR